MPRRRRGTRISDSGARKVAGRMCFAAAAEALGGLYGSTCLERALCFSPSARAERLVPSDLSAHRPKRPWPTGGCKKWLHGHVVNDQTLSLIAQTQPRVAERMRQARDGDVVKALVVSPVDYRFVGARISKLSPGQFGNYLGCMVRGDRDPHFASRLTADLLHRALDGDELEVLVVVISLDRQLTSLRTYATAKCLKDAFAVALRNAAKSHPEIAFAKEALADAWSQHELIRRIQAQAESPFPWRNCSWYGDANSESSRPSCVKPLINPRLQL